MNKEKTEKKVWEYSHNQHTNMQVIFMILLETVKYRRGGSTGRRRSFHHSFPTLSEKKNGSEDISVLFKDRMRKVIKRSPISDPIKGIYLGQLWISWCVFLGAAGFRVFSHFFVERARPAASMRPPCLIYLPTRTGTKLRAVSS